MTEQDALKKENRILRAKLDRAVQQRNGFMDNYHAIAKIPFSERAEVIADCDHDLDNLNEPTEPT